MIYDEYETRGDHRSAMIRFVEHLVKREKIEIHKGSERAWLHLDDAVVAFEKLIYVDKYHIFNIGNDEFVKIEYLARIIAEELGLELEQYAKFIDLPLKMTLVKRPNLRKMKEILGVVPKVTLREGVKRVIKSVLSEYSRTA